MIETRINPVEQGRDGQVIAQLPGRAQTSKRLAPDYRQWRAAVEATGGCAAPIQLRGSTTILDRDGQILIERGGDVPAHPGIPTHHRRMIETAWELGGHPTTRG